jgi:hypothetical protein
LTEIAYQTKAHYLDYSSYSGTYNGSHPTQPELLSPLIASALETPDIAPSLVVASVADLSATLDAIKDDTGSTLTEVGKTLKKDQKYTLTNTPNSNANVGDIMFEEDNT